MEHHCHTRPGPWWPCCHPLGLWAPVVWAVVGKLRAGSRWILGSPALCLQEAWPARKGIHTEDSVRGCSLREQWSTSGYESQLVCVEQEEWVWLGEIVLLEEWEEPGKGRRGWEDWPGSRPWNGGACASKYLKKYVAEHKELALGS